jgi:hypothetical protein
MPNNYKTPAQLVPPANTLSTLYTVPGETQVVISNIHACNFGNTTSSLRIAIRPNGSSIENSHYLFFGLNVAANDTIEFGHGITMDDSDVISVFSSSGSVSFNMSYSEITE